MTNEATRSQIGKYRIDRVLGTGAMGVVYLAFDPHIERPVAIKTVRRELLANEGDADSDVLQRFRNEARAAGRLAHPNIVTIHDFGEDGDTAYIVMEYVAGNGLDALLPPGHVPPLATALDWLAQLLAALAYAHEAGVVHRDIKPANLLVTARGLLKVADFGVARIGASATSFGSIIGTPSFMSPEQFAGESVDARSDLFSAGVVLYRMLTGRQPFVGSAAVVMRQIMNEMPARPSGIVRSLPPAIDAMVEKALAKRPGDRFASAAQWLADLRALMAGASQVDDDRTIVAASGAAFAEPAGIGTTTDTHAAPAGQIWPPELLERIERQLATHIGPLASLLVRRAAAQAVDLGTLTEQLLSSLTNQSTRSEFERILARLTSGTSGASMATSSSSSSLSFPAGESVATQRTARESAAGMTTAGEIDQASIDATAMKLAVYLGPIAKVIARREARRAANLDEFYRLVEACIADATQRQRFRRDLG
ncbi:serine/threonine-protein kinase [Burkholderia guangdongensis]|uniref:serine/threonine-protein kinase n=1 Tax=Burkholderia guangdongensis TaxID=1792500 RepID=UPI0015CA145A|nr:serine/threonine-protein kinase [Burkholderia guangdongensis]